MKPLISIIIPTYNRAHLIGETLDSILEQTYKNWECIIVDDGSTDNTNLVVTNYVSKDSRFQYHHRPNYKQKGPSSCRNYGFELSKGDFVNWFDSDDLYTSNALSTWLKHFDEKNDVVVAKLVRIDSETRLKISENRILSNTIVEDYFIGNISFFVCGPLWKRAFLDKQEEIFDEGIMNLDDWDFNLRMLYQNPIIAYINIPLIQYRIHDNSLSQEINKFNFSELMSEFKARKKHIALIRKNKKANLLVLQTYDKQRCKYFLRTALVSNHDNRTSLFKMLLIRQIRVLDIKGLLKTSFGFLTYYLFNKGDVLFK